MRGRFFILPILACLGLLMQVAGARADKRVALVVGNSNYKNTATLANPANDAQDMAVALRGLGFEVIFKLDTDKREFDTLVARFARASRDADTSLFFYAGHGMQFQGRNYVMPVDAELEDEISLRYQMANIDDVKIALEQSPGVKIMVLDACRNNPLAERFIRSISKGTRDIGAVRGFARPEQTRGMVVAYSTQADDTAQDGAGRNSPFTRAFLGQLKEPGLEIGSMFRRVAAEVYAETKGRQIPELSISLLSEYALNQSETDRTIWGRIRNSSDATTLREFVSRFPNSFFAPDARLRLDFVERALQSKDTTASAEQAAAIRAKEAAEQEQRTKDIQTRERELAARLAAAEAEQKRMAAELAARNEERVAAEARQKTIEAAQRERDERMAADARKKAESDAVARRDQEKAAADAAAVRARTDAEARAKTLAEQAARDKQVQQEAERARVLKEEVARLEAEVARARADSQAEQKKAAAAVIASKAADLKVASVAPTVLPKPSLTDEQNALVAPIQTEMRRLGCLAGAGGDWSAASMKTGLTSLARYAKLAAIPDAPSSSLLDDLKARKDRLCPLFCGVKDEERNGRCVRKTCGRSEILDDDGDCVAKPVARTKKPAPAVAEPRAKPKPERVARPRAERPVAAVSRPASGGGGGGGGGGRCFAFSGRQYCE